MGAGVLGGRPVPEGGLWHHGQPHWGLCSFLASFLHVFHVSRVSSVFFLRCFQSVCPAGRVPG